MSNISDNTSKASKWLQNARYKRLNSTIQAKASEVNDLTDSLIFHANIKATEIESSGLSSYEVQMIQEWHRGTITGSQALIAIYNHRYHTLISTKLQGDPEHEMKNFKPIELLSLSISFPANSLSIIERKIYHMIFAKSPKLAIKDTLELIKEKSMEKSLKMLTIEQVNLALKQIQLDHMISSIKKPEMTVEKENHQNETATATARESEEAMLTKDDDKLYYQVMIELLKLHVQSFSKDPAPSLLPTNTANPLASDHIFDFFSKSSSKLFKPKSDEDHQVDTNLLGMHLMTPIPTIQEQSLHLSIEALESANSSYKPYLRHLASLKSILAHQVKNFEDSKAYIALGVEKDASDNSVKKAYRNMAIKLHPDKPGGNTAKFQQLQTYYQEILKTRGQRQAVHKRFEERKLDPQNVEMIRKTTEMLNDLWKYVENIQMLTSNASMIHQQYNKFIKKVHKKINKTKENVMEFILQYWRSHNIANDMMVHCERVCEFGQQFASLAMNLPNIHRRYGMLITSSPNGSQYLRDIESMMGASLDILRFVADILSADHAIQSEYLLQKMMNSLETFHQIMKKSINMMMNVSLTGVQIYSFVQTIIDRIDESLFEEVKQDVKLEEEFHGFSFEDQEILRQRRANFSPSPSTPAPTSSSTDVSECENDSTKKDSSETETDKDKTFNEESSAKDSHNDTDGCSEEKVSSASHQLDELRSRIHSLQMKLHVQNIQIFQSLNQEVRDLQCKLQYEVLDVLKAWDDGASVQSKQVVFTVLADCIDRSLVNLNADVVKDKEALSERLVCLLQQHLGWMLELQGSYKLTSEELFSDAASLEATSSSSRIALLPDYRSKTLWLASLMDHTAVIEIVRDEMFARLCPLIKTSEGSEDRIAAQRLCDLVLKGVKVVALPAPQV